MARMHSGSRDISDPHSATEVKGQQVPMKVDSLSYSQCADAILANDSEGESASVSECLCAAYLFLERLVTLTVHEPRP